VQHAEGAARTTDGGRPLRAYGYYGYYGYYGSAVTGGGQEALAFASVLPAAGSATAAGAGAGLAAS
jgi:hypothetical protein